MIILAAALLAKGLKVIFGKSIFTERKSGDSLSPYSIFGFDNMLIDLSEAFSWVRSCDLQFRGIPDFGHPDGCHIEVHETSGKSFHFLTLREGLYFRIAELITTDFDMEDGAETLEPRHTALVCANLKIPPSIPKNKDFIGPINEVNLLRILHLAQAHIRKDKEMQNQIRHDLNLSFPSVEEKAPYIAGENVVPLFCPALAK